MFLEKELLTAVTGPPPPDSYTAPPSPEVAELPENVLDVMLSASVVLPLLK